MHNIYAQTSQCGSCYPNVDCIAILKWHSWHQIWDSRPTSIIIEPNSLGPAIDSNIVMSQVNFPAQIMMWLHRLVVKQQHCLTCTAIYEILRDWAFKIIDVCLVLICNKISYKI